MTAQPPSTPATATKREGCVMPGALMTADLDVTYHQTMRDRRHVDASTHRLAFRGCGGWKRVQAAALR
jgi:hypothetical protein